MKNTLEAGLTYEFEYLVPENRTVPHLLPEAEEFAVMPQVLATGYMVGLIEWTCIQAVNPHLDWPTEQTVGIGIEVSHLSPTPPRLTVKVAVELTKVEGRKLTFAVRADDGHDKITEGTHQRFVVDPKSLTAKARAKLG